MILLNWEGIVSTTSPTVSVDFFILVRRTKFRGYNVDELHMLQSGIKCVYVTTCYIRFTNVCCDYAPFMIHVLVCYINVTSMLH